MKQKNLILDTDPGIDDAIALAVVRRYLPESVRLVVSSYGNTSIENTTCNALTMLSLLSWDVPVVKGAPRSESGHYEDASHIHGADGLGGMGVHSSSRSAVEGDFLAHLYRSILECGQADYITLGPLTNLALLLRRFPDVKPHIGRVVAMGGGIAFGNVTPYAEFNIYCDPESAGFVLREMPDVALVPLDTTSRVAFPIERINNLPETSELCRAMKKILTANYHACVRYGEAGSTMHDATAVLFYLKPELFSVRRCGINVSTLPETLGQTIETDSRTNITLTESADANLLLDFIEAAII